MTTKFYFHAANSTVTGTLPSTEQSSLTPDANFFTGVTDADNKSMTTTIGVSQANLTNTSTADTSAHNYYIMKWVSPLIYESNIQAKTWTLEYGAKEANAAANFPVSGTGVAGRVNCYVWKPSDGTKIGTILDGNTNNDCEEAGTSQSVINCTFAGAAVTGMIPGDAVIVIELWAIVTQANGTARVQDIYYDGTTENSTSNEAAFLSTPQDLVLTPTSGAETIVAMGGSSSSTANTTQYWTVVGSPISPSTTETDVALKIREAGTIHNLSIFLQANTITGTTSFTVMKNGSPTSLVANATTTGAQLIEDLSNTVSVSAGDTISLKTVPGAATNTFTINAISLNFLTTDGKSCQLTGASRSITFSSQNATRYIPLNGDATPDSTEAEAKVRQKKAGTYRYLYVNVLTNSRTTDVTFRSRKNGNNGNLSVTYTSGQTGVKEDTTNSDVVAVDDDYDIQLVTSTGTENIVYTIVAVTFYADDQSGFLETGNLNTITIAANLTRYMVPGGTNAVITSEANAKRKVRLTRMTVVGIQCYLVQNTVSATSTLTLRKNGAAGNNAISITSNTPGFYQDNAHTDEFYSGDDMALEIVTGATGTQVEFSQITIFYKVPRVTSSKIYKWNLLGRISLSRIYKYNIIGRISLSRIYKYNILTRISLSRSYLWNIVNRVSLSRSYLWNIIGRVSLSRIYKYHIVGRISLSRTYLWNILTRVSLSRTYLWNILARVSLSRTYLWNIIGRISLSRIYKYNIVGRISLSRIYKYDLLGRISLSRIYKYNVLSRVSLSRSYLYNIIGRISLINVYKYNIIGRVSLSRNYLWNVIGRVSLARTYLWDIAAGGLERISKAQVYKWNILQRVSLSRVYKHNVLSRVSLSRIYSWNLLSRITKPSVLKWNIIGRVSLARIYKYHIVIRVSLSRSYIWNITNRVSQSSIFMWNILKRISLSRIYRWDFAAHISTRGRGITGKLESKERFPKRYKKPPWYNSILSKPHRNSKYTKG